MLTHAEYFSVYLPFLLLMFTRFLCRPPICKLGSIKSHGMILRYVKNAY